jgi:hypothetical protein
MEIARLSLAPQHRPRLLALDHAIRYRVHVLPPDIDWRVALTKEYWLSCIGSLEVGDKVEVHSADHRIQFLVYIFDCNDLTSQVRFDCGFAPLWPRDLQLPDPMIDAALFLTVANAQGGYDVVEAASGARVASASGLMEARQIISALETREAQLREQAEAAAAAAAAADIEAAVAALAARATDPEAA